MDVMSIGRQGIGAMHGSPGSGAMRSLRGPGKKPPPLMDPTRQRDGRRILRAVQALPGAADGRAGDDHLLRRDQHDQPVPAARGLDVGLLEHDEKVLTEPCSG